MKHDTIDKDRLRRVQINNGHSYYDEKGRFCVKGGVAFAMGVPKDTLNMFQPNHLDLEMMNVPQAMWTDLCAVEKQLMSPCDVKCDTPECTPRITPEAAKEAMLVIVDKYYGDDGKLRTAADAEV